MHQKKNIIISPELFNSTQKELIYTPGDVVLSARPDQELSNLYNREEIYIYDLGFCKQNKIIPINNHINKTGINPLRETQKSTISFYDITNIYEKQQRGKIAECFGQREPTSLKSIKHIQTRFLCNYVIIAHLLGFKKIFAYVVD